MRSDLPRRPLSTDVVLFLGVLAITLLPLLLGVRAIFFADQPLPLSGAVLSTIRTRVDVDPIGIGEFDEVEEEQALVTGDKVLTGDIGRGTVTFIDDSDLILEPSSEITILPPARRGGGLVNRFSQTFGSSWSQFSSVVQGGAQHEIETPNGVISVRDGALLRVGVGQDETGQEVVGVVVLEGSADFASDIGEAVISAGEQLVVAEEDTELMVEPAVLPNEVGISLSGGALLLVHQVASNLATGAAGSGSTNQIPLSITSGPGTNPQSVNILQPEGGEYLLYLQPSLSNAPYTIEAVGYSAETAVFGYQSTGQHQNERWLYYTLSLETDDLGNLVGGTMSGPFSAACEVDLVVDGISEPCPEGDSEVSEPTPEPTQVPDTPTPVPTATPAATPSPSPAPTQTPIPTPTELPMPSIGIEPIGQATAPAFEYREFIVALALALGSLAVTTLARRRR